MNKITSINLNGRAYQLEEKAYEKLHAYLERAQHKLAQDPDKDEVMHDFEQAIAEKCDQLLSGHKNVITVSEMQTIIEAMGPVEAGEEPKDERAKTAAPSQPKRLYTLKDGAILGGVCSGLAAYLNLDVTVVRLLFIVLTFVSGGFWILIYFGMMFLLPEAVTPEQKAELRGQRFSAQDVLERAKQKYSEVTKEVTSDEHWKSVSEQAKPAMSKAGAVTLAITRGIAAVVATFTAATLAAITVVFIVTVWWIVFGHIDLPDQLHDISHWELIAASTAFYLVCMVPFVLVTKGLMLYARARKYTNRHTFGALVWLSVWIIAAGVSTAIALINNDRLQAYQQTHGYIYLGPNNTHAVCINENFCEGSLNQNNYHQWHGKRDLLSPEHS